MTSPGRAPTGQILTRLRKLMTDTKVVPKPLAAYVVPSRDAHNSEYLAARDKRRDFVSGFTGSAGVAVITEKEALLWTDGRYHQQAQREMDINWTLIKARIQQSAMFMLYKT